MRSMYTGTIVHYIYFFFLNIILFLDPCTLEKQIINCTGIQYSVSKCAKRGSNDPTVKISEKWPNLCQFWPKMDIFEYQPKKLNRHRFHKKLRKI